MVALLVSFKNQAVNRTVGGADDDSDWDEEGDIVCSGLPQDVELLSERKQRLFVLQDLLANLGIEA